MTVAPADSTGVHPALIGHVPLTVGRRVLVAFVDSLLSFAWLLVVAQTATWLGWIRPGTALRMSPTSLLIVAAWFAPPLYAMFARSARVAGLFLGAQYLDVQTGHPAGGRLFLKNVLGAVVYAVTFGIGPLIIVFASVRPPLNRNWFDRTTGLVLVDTRGRGLVSASDPGQHTAATSTPQPQPQPTQPTHAPGTATAPPSFAPVSLPATPPTGGVPSRPSFEPPLPVATDEQATALRTPPARPSASPANPYSFPEPGHATAPSGSSAEALNSVVGPDGLITAIPGRTPSPAPAPRPTEPPYIQEAPPVPDEDSLDHTVIDGSRPSPDASVTATLDDGTVVSLSPPTVLGRNPQPPTTHPNARVVALHDTSMRMSKTHALVGHDEAGAWVIDLNSTNGVHLSMSDAEPQRIQSGVLVHVEPGARVTLGGRSVRFQ